MKNIRPPRRRYYPLQWAATAAIVLGAMLLDLPGRWHSDVSTGTGEMIHQRLSDGSRMSLNTATRVSIDVDDQQRRVTLYNGEAYFEVENNPHLPFQVISGKSDITAKGTEFTVRKSGNQVRVAVKKGMVNLRRNQQEDSARTLLAGDSADSSRRGITVEKSGALPQDFSWVQNRFIFVDQPLYQVVNEIGRYYSGMILVRDNGLKNLRVTGDFFLDNPLDSLQTLADIHRVKLTSIGGMIIILSKDSGI